MRESLVLIVEDDTLIQQFGAPLHDDVYATPTEVSGEAAMGKLELCRLVRALITDIHLKDGASGWDVARRARELYADLPEMYVTSVAAEEWTSQGVRASRSRSRSRRHKSQPPLPTVERCLLLLRTLKLRTTVR